MSTGTPAVTHPGQGRFSWLSEQSRARWIAFFLVLASVNGLANRIRANLSELGVLDSLAGLFGVSAIVWFSLYAMFELARSDGSSRSPDRLDISICLICLLLILLPFAFYSLIVLSILSAYFFVRSQSGAIERRLAVIGLALAFNLFWGNVLLQFFGSELLGLDAWLAGQFGGMRIEGNLIYSFDGTRRFIMTSGCSSLANISLAVLATVTFAQLWKMPFDWRIILVGAVAILAMIAVNMIRLWAYAYFPDHFEYLHDGAGQQIFVWMGTLAILAIVGGGIWQISRRSGR